MNLLGRLVIVLLLCSGLFGCTTVHSVADVTQHFEAGKAAMAQNQSEVALREYVWCWRVGRDNPECDNLRRQSVLKELAALARVYPAAFDALHALRREAQEAMFRPPGGVRSPAPFSVSGGYLGSSREAHDMDAARGYESYAAAQITRPASTPDPLTLGDRVLGRTDSPAPSGETREQQRAADDARAINRVLWSI